MFKNKECIKHGCDYCLPATRQSSRNQEKKGQKHADINMKYTCKLKIGVLRRNQRSLVGLKFHSCLGQIVIR